jgi:glutamate racemase
MIGIFDSGSGGMSVFREIYKVLPREKYVYYADNANCPYGGKSREFILGRSRAITDFLLREGADIIVIACNTATSAAVATLREEYPEVRFIGMEPALKPAALTTTTGVVGVLATEATLKGDKYLSAKEKYGKTVKIAESVGKGFVEMVERGVLSGPEAEETVRRSLSPLIEAGADKIVLGCTHYPFLIDVIRSIAGEGVTVMDPAPAVAAHLRDVMLREGLIRNDAETSDGPGITLVSSGKGDSLERIYSLVINQL